MSGESEQTGNGGEDVATECESLDEKEISLLSYTLTKGRVRFTEYVKEFEQMRGWSHESLVQRIGSKGRLQKDGWLTKSTQEGESRQSYSIPQEKALYVRLISFSLSGTTDRKYAYSCIFNLTDIPEIASACSRLGYKEKEVKDLLHRLQVTVLSDRTDELYWPALMHFLRMILKDADRWNSGFTLIIDYDPRRTYGMITDLGGLFIQNAIIEGLKKGTNPPGPVPAIGQRGAGPASPLDA
jgi:hypothetical protein